MLLDQDRWKKHQTKSKTKNEGIFCVFSDTADFFSGKVYTLPCFSSFIAKGIQQKAKIMDLNVYPQNGGLEGMLLMIERPFKTV